MKYLLQDGLQSLRGMSDGNDMLSAQAYSPYGEPMFTDMPTEFGFTGEQTDPLNDLVYLRARYMNPRWGVFGSLDPLEGQNQVVGSLNRYNWVRGNVVNLRDASGMSPCNSSLGDMVKWVNQQIKHMQINASPALYFGHTVDALQGSSQRIDDYSLRAMPNQINVTDYPVSNPVWDMFRKYQSLINDPVIDYGGIALAGLGLVGATVAALAFAPAALILAVAAGIGAMGLNTIEQVEDMRWKWENRSTSFLNLLPQINTSEAAVSGLYGVGMGLSGFAGGVAKGVMLFGSAASTATTVFASPFTGQPLDTYSLLSNSYWGGISWGWGTATAAAVYYKEMETVAKLLVGLPLFFQTGAITAWMQSGVDQAVTGNEIPNINNVMLGSDYANLGSITTSNLLGFGVTLGFNLAYQLWLDSHTNP